jgi:hypothetical protein
MQGGEGVINAGIYFLPSIWLNEEVKHEAFSMENDLIPLWLSEGRKIRVEEVDTPFLDIGTPEDYRQAESFFTSLGGAINDYHSNPVSNFIFRRRERLPEVDIQAWGGCPWVWNQQVLLHFPALLASFFLAPLSCGLFHYRDLLHSISNSASRG